MNNLILIILLSVGISHSAYANKCRSLFEGPEVIHGLFKAEYFPPKVRKLIEDESYVTEIAIKDNKVTLTIEDLHIVNEEGAFDFFNSRTVVMRAETLIKYFDKNLVVSSRHDATGSDVSINQLRHKILLNLSQENVKNSKKEILELENGFELDVLAAKAKEFEPDAFLTLVQKAELRGNSVTLHYESFVSHYSYEGYLYKQTYKIDTVIKALQEEYKDHRGQSEGKKFLDHLLKRKAGII